MIYRTVKCRNPMYSLIHLADSIKKQISTIKSWVSLHSILRELREKTL